MASDLTPEELAHLRRLTETGLSSTFGIRVFPNELLPLLDMAERCADYDRRLSEVMPVDFKDWWQNAKAEWPEVAAGVVTNLRERLEQAERERDHFAHKVLPAMREQLERHRKEAERFDSEEWTNGGSEA